MIEVQSLNKSFVNRSKTKSKDKDTREEGKWFHALRDVSFSVPTGSILGLLGPNGAGKTTFMRVLSTALKPTSGTIQVDGVDIAKDPLSVRRRIGFLSGNTGLYGRLTPREMIRYYGTLHGLDKAQLNQTMTLLFDRLEINAFADKRNDHLSAGMKQKVNIARTLIHNPEVIIFDEPTTGLDVKAAEQILRLVEELKTEGRTILFSTHHMHEVERLTDQIVLLNMGTVHFNGNLAQMREKGGDVLLDKAFLNLIGEGERHVA
ncbi:MAG: ATP-binding cassette domain-containing protein [Acidobacteria bacterium]|nr:ATP-binding cassette domain-containing protein [Acidobacteriota bacterium]MCB9397202.1 ATP-binding cassette domain-containing protein [Acidobacteriota bacterium]